MPPPGGPYDELPPLGGPYDELELPPPYDPLGKEELEPGPAPDPSDEVPVVDGTDAVVVVVADAVLQLAQFVEIVSVTSV